MDATELMKEWGGWIAAAIFGWWGMRDGRVNELIDLRVKPADLHETLERIEGKVDSLDGKVDALTERTARLEGSYAVLPSDGPRARLNVKGN